MTTTPPKNFPAALLRFLLRYVGSVSLLALVAVFLPYSWMDATHRWLTMAIFTLAFTLARPSARTGNPAPGSLTH